MLMTQEQIKLIEDNYEELMKRCLHIYKIDLEEFSGILSIGLCKAAITFNERADCEFTTYAITCMRQEHKNYIRDSYNQKRSIHHSVSYEDTFEIENNIDYSEPIFEPHFFLNDLKQFVNPFQFEIIELLAHGLIKKDIANLLCIPEHKVYHNINQIRKILLKNKKGISWLK